MDIAPRLSAACNAPAATTLASFGARRAGATFRWAHRGPPRTPPTPTLKRGNMLTRNRAWPC
eukprot:5220108-Lingulodinium_polyedra.AAC.1